MMSFEDCVASAFVLCVSETSPFEAVHTHISLRKEKRVSFLHVFGLHCAADFVVQGSRVFCFCAVFGLKKVVSENMLKIGFPNDCCALERQGLERQRT